MVNWYYRYMADLLSLEATATGVGPATFRPSTPLQPLVWEKALASHPDRHSISQGFHIGADRSVKLLPCRNNMPSVCQQLQLVETHIHAELAAGRLLGPLPPNLALLAHTSSIGLIPKPHQPGKWRLIVDLSSPTHHSVNDAIAADKCHMHYASVLDAASYIRHLGTGASLAKVDLENAYRIVSVHPDDHHLLRFCWGNQVYIDTALPFGLRSAPKIFSALADALAWVLHSKGVIHQLHYLDDFLLLGAPNSPECSEALQRTYCICSELGVPLASHKTEGPSCQLTFLGIHIDSIGMQLSLPPDKLACTIATVQSWSRRKVASKRELQSLIGTLIHAATVVPHGRTFLRRMIETMKVPTRPKHYVRFNGEFRSDL